MFRQIPFVRLLLSYICGITAAFFCPVHLSVLGLVIGFGALLTIVTIFSFINFHWVYRWAYGFILNIVLFCLGVLLTSGHPHSSSIPTDKEIDILARVLDPPEVRLTSTRIVVNISQVFVDGAWKPTDEDALIYFPSSDSLAKGIGYGSILAIRASFTSPPKPLNPYQFDFGKYLSAKGIFLVGNVFNGNWSQMGTKEHWLYSNAFKFRQYTLGVFSRFGIRDENLAVLSALTMGYKGLLDNETRRVFSASGAMHILAVSGLHVGIIFGVIAASLFFLNRVKKGQLLKSFILILFLWGYALFTGFSPSVIRATLMFSLVIVGTSISRRTNIYNTIAASAFIILVGNPNLLLDVGFQLSYVAVLSIVFFYPYIYQTLYVKNKWLDKLWALVCVSLAAQIGTFAISLYYFNQFPTYFLLTNLYAIPLATAILCIAIALVVIAPVPLLSSWLGWTLCKALSLLNFLVSFTESLPYSTLSDIYVSSSQLVFLALFLVFTAFLLVHRKSTYVLGILVMLLLFFAEGALALYSTLKQTEVVIFASKQSSLIGYREGQHLQIFTSDTLDDRTASNYDYTIGGYTRRVNAKAVLVSLQSEPSNLPPNFNAATHKNTLGIWLSLKGKLFLIPDGSILSNYTASVALPVDYLLVNRQSARSIEKILRLISPTEIIIDASVPSWQLEKVENVAMQYGYKTYAISKHGALVF